MLLGGKDSCFEFESLSPTKFRLSLVPHQMLQVQVCIVDKLDTESIPSQFCYSSFRMSSNHQTFRIPDPKSKGHSWSQWRICYISKRPMHMKLAVDGVVQSRG